MLKECEPLAGKALMQWLTLRLHSLQVAKMIAKHSLGVDLRFVRFSLEELVTRSCDIAVTQPLHCKSNDQMGEAESTCNTMWLELLLSSEICQHLKGPFWK